MTIRKRIPLARLILSDVYVNMGPECAFGNLDFLYKRGIRGDTAERLAGCPHARLYSIGETLSEYKRWLSETKYAPKDIVDIISSSGYPLLGSWKDKLKLVDERSKGRKKSPEINENTLIQVIIEEDSPLKKK